MSDPKSFDDSVPPSWGGPLTEEDYAALAAAGIDREMADQAMLRRVGAQEGGEIVGQPGNRDCSGLLFSYYWPGESFPFNDRIRRDHPEWEQGKDGRLKPRGKYLGPPGGANRLYFPPGVTLEQLNDPTIPIVVTEGEKKALALWRLANYQTQRPRFIPIAIAGVWNWRGTIGKGVDPNGARIDIKGVIPDFNRIDWNGRKVFILFDTDVHTNEKVSAARGCLAQEMASREADVSFVNLPEDSGVKGVDDLLGIWGPERVLELFKSAEPAISKEQRRQATALIQLAAEARFFHTPEDEAFAEVQSGANRHHVLMIRSAGFRSWLIRAAYRKFRKPPATQALQEAIGVLEAQARFDSPEARLFVRVAEHDGRIYIDLSNANGEVVEITEDGWSIVNDPPVHFRRPRGMRPLPTPVGGGSVTQLRRFINVGDDNNWILCLAWLIAVFRAQGPYPILILHGEQGSAKSTMAKILRRLIDPSVSLIRTPPRDERDLLIAATNSWVVAYDNLSRLLPWQSDALCRLATGGGFSTRELYSDAEEIFLDAARPVILNGIEHLAERPDLADRALILDLPPIADDARQEEADLYAELEREFPQILGALLTAVSGALARLPNVRLRRRPRMADFARWATAAEVPLGFSEGAFMSAFSGNRADAVRETLEADPVGAAITAMMDRLRESGVTRWCGISQELKGELENLVDEGTKKAPEWPKNPRGLAGRLRRLATFLREVGIQITFPPKGTKGRRALTIQRIDPQPTATNATTATPPTDSPENHSDTTEPAGGGHSERWDDTLPGSDQPPPPSPVPDPLQGLKNHTQVAEVAIVAVSNTNSLDDGPNPTNGSRTDLCSLCGRNDWEWDGGRWVCRHCNTPAGHRARMERIEL